MKQIKYYQLILLACILTFIVVGSVAGCSKKKTQAGQTTSAHDHKEEIWTCPMHPQIKKDGPGSCPICGMNLVKVDNTEKENTGKDSPDSLPGGHASFKLSHQRQQLIGVKTSTVEKKLLFKSIKATGRVAFDPELFTAQKEYIEALKQRESLRRSSLEEVRKSAERTVESAKLRLKILGISDSQISDLFTSGSTGENLLVTKSGEKIWVYAEVFEMDTPNIRSGMDAEITGEALGAKTLTGKVVSIDRVINPDTRTTKVRIIADSDKILLRPGAYVNVTIHSPLGEQITVPFDAVLNTGEQSWIFVVKENVEFEPRLITIRYRADNDIAVESGVEPGEKIVTSANFLIDSESRLKGILKSQKDKTVECPKGQVWHEQMGHCMPKVGE